MEIGLVQGKKTKKELEVQSKLSKLEAIQKDVCKEEEFTEANKTKAGSKSQKK